MMRLGNETRKEITHAHLFQINYPIYREKDEILTESKQEIQREREREQKWLKMLKQWENTDTNKLKRRIYKGIPNAIRGKIWSKLLGLDAIKEEQRGKYKVYNSWSFDVHLKQFV